MDGADLRHTSAETYRPGCCTGRPLEPLKIVAVQQQCRWLGNCKPRDGFPLSRFQAVVYCRPSGQEVTAVDPKCVDGPSGGRRRSGENLGSGIEGLQ